MRSLKPSVATSPSRKPPSYASESTLYQTARLADKIVELTLSLCELHPLLHLEHNPINQAVLKKTSRVLLATITFIGKDTNALRKLSLLYQLGQYHRIGTIGRRGNYALHQPLPIGQHVLFVSVAIVPAFAHPTSFRIDPWLATFQLILISRSWACSSSVRKSSRSSVTSMRILLSGACGLST